MQKRPSLISHNSSPNVVFDINSNRDESTKKLRNNHMSQYLSDSKQQKAEGFNLEQKRENES